MNKKELIKKFVGPIGIECIRKAKMVKRIINATKAGTTGSCEVYNSAELVKDLSLQDKNVFFGYYDLQQMNAKQDKLLVHVCNKNARTAVDAIKIGYYDLKNDIYIHISDSYAWSWQQGCRLRWNPRNEQEIIFNNMVDGKYVCQIWDIDKKELSRTIPIPLYDIDKNLKYGLGVNFSRLQRLRPGYGYNSLPDKTIKENIPANDGIYRYDFDTEQVKLIINYDQLCENLPDANNNQHYINHISISPDGSKFMFFHIYTKGAGMAWHVRLCVSDMDGDKIKVLEETETISHYTWNGNDQLLTTCINKDENKSCYAVYDINTRKRTVIGGKDLCLDGHPTYMQDNRYFISDTYPQKDCLQHVFVYDTELNKYNKLVDIFHSPRLYEEQRCDLHPRLTPDNKWVTIDTVYKDNKRSVLLFKIK